MLMRRWERARQGDGQLVLIVGEPGLGKSRLIKEFHTRISDTPHTWVEWSCSQLLQNTLLHPIAEWGRMRFGGADIPTEQRLAELESSLAQVNLDPGENAVLLGLLLDMPLPADRVPDLPPEKLRRRQLAALSVGDGRRAGSAGRAGTCALGRSHLARPFARYRRTGGTLRHYSFSSPLVRSSDHLGAIASRHYLASAARLPSGPAHGRRTSRPSRAANGSGRGCDRTHWRRAAVCRGRVKIACEPSHSR
jgi:AAA ATPase domain